MGVTPRDIKITWQEAAAEVMKTHHKTFQRLAQYEEQEKMSGGTKHDEGKPSITLVPKEALWGMAKAFDYGAKKYGRHNFREGIAYSRLADACDRHLSAYMDGETLDPESGNNHLFHALASLAMLTYMDANKPELDDRYKKEK